MPVLDVISSGASPAGTIVLSAPSVTASSTTSTALWWLIDPDNSDNNMTVEVIGDSLPQTSSEVQAQHIGLGNPYITVIAAQILGATFQITIDFLNDPTYEKFVYLRSLQKVLLLNAPYGEQYWIRMGSDVTPTIMNAAGLYRQVTLTVIEQARPAA